MQHPNKPQLAFAWIGAPKILSTLWADMIQTPFQEKPPRELLHRPQILAADTETWSYRFSRCEKLSELLYMRVNARRHSGLLWCKEAKAVLTNEEYKMLCYAGGCRLPVVIFLQNITEATEEADQEEQGLRLLLDELGFLADEAIFVYGANNKPRDAITHLYQRLDHALPATEERSLPPLMLRCEEVNLLFFIGGQPGLTEQAPHRAYLKHEIQTLQLKDLRLLHKHQSPSLTSVTLRAKFEAQIALRPECIFSGSLMYNNIGELPSRECVVII
jgi:hypothetical protein